MNQKQPEPKKAQTRNSTNKKGPKPKRAQTKKGPNQKGHKPKRAQTKKGTNQKGTDVTCGKLQYFNQNTILLYLGIETPQMTAI